MRKVECEKREKKVNARNARKRLMREKFKPACPPQIIGGPAAGRVRGSRFNMRIGMNAGILCPGLGSFPF